MVGPVATGGLRRLEAEGRSHEMVVGAVTKKIAHAHPDQTSTPLS